MRADTVKIATSSKNISIIHQDGNVKYFPEWLLMSEADRLFELLIRKIEWKQEITKMFGKTLPFPRLTAWYGDKGRLYSYSGVVHHALKWLPSLLLLKNRLESETDNSFNSVLCNNYRNGFDSVSWHSDNEKELGKCPAIASVSLGAKRLFKLKHKVTGKQLSVELTHGSLLLMVGETQSNWLHCVPKTKKQPDQARINLTFRNIICN